MYLNNFLWHIVIANLFLLLLLSVFIYRYSKDRVFLLYTLYNLFLLGYVLLKSDFLFPNSIYKKILPVNWGIQIIYNSFLVYFGIAFVNLKKHYPKAIKIIDSILKGFIVIGTIGCIFAIVFQDKFYYFTFFTFGYLPIQLGIGFYLLYLASKTTEKQKYYYFIGISSYIIFALTAFILTVTDNINIGPFVAISFFYIGIIIEGTVFIFGLGQRVKKMYSEKLSIQKKLMITQKELNKELEEKIKKVEIEKQLVNLEFSLMTSKMNSHFLFNALNSIKLYIIENEQQSAITYLNKFSEFIRRVLETTSIKSITLEEELYVSQLYMDIENVRFNYEINFKIEADSKLSIQNIKVPPFILQPFLENAIWHGVASKKDKQISLSLTQKEQNIVIEITDNGIGRKQAGQIKKQKSAYKKSLGLHIVNQILTNSYKNKFHLEYIDLHNEDKSPKGTKVVLKLPT